MARALPDGTVTFLFTDVEGSTRLLQELGDERYAKALAEHRHSLRAAFEARSGVEVDTQGDAFFVAFPTAPGALLAAADARERLVGGPIRVRMGLHTGTPLVTDDGYVGADVHRAARIAACGHGGQILVSSSTASLVDRAALVDLGLHRLKDLSAPERIFQLGEGKFPALKSLYRTNLPVPATPFLGRETELGDVCALLTRDEVRILTLTGAGGSGKTRLALQSAGALAELFPDGVYWVPLAPLRDPQLVLQGAAQAVGADDGLAEHIADGRLLLLLDNFEHLSAAATDAAALLVACPNLRLLVTSREPLHVRGEHEYPVPPLAPREAVDFFTTKARAVKPDFVPDESVPAICSRLDDLPLALELAGARVKALTSAQILERLEHRLPLLTGGARDAPERQRTLRATIDWSYDLLTDDEQRLYARLAVFRGGCTLDAAEQIADADLDTLQSLVDKSLLRHNEGRYWMLETIREHAAERLDATGEAAELRRRHTNHFVDLAETAYPELTQEWLRGGRAWSDRLEARIDELRAALDELERSGDTQRVLGMAGALTDLWAARGHAGEGLSRLERALAADHSPTESRARALEGAAGLAGLYGDTRAIRRWATEALELHRAFDNPYGVASSLHTLGYAALEEADWDEGTRLLEEANELYAKLGGEHELLWGLRTLGFAASESGDLERGREIYEEALTRARALGSRAVEGTLLGALSWLAAKQERAGDALRLLRESLLVKREVGERSDVGEALCRSARVFAATGDELVGARLLGCFDALSDSVGSGEAWVQRMNEETRALLGATLDDATLAAVREEGARMTLEEGLDYALEALEREREAGR